jgi:hypothetical protein
VGPLAFTFGLSEVSSWESTIFPTAVAEVHLHAASFHDQGDWLAVGTKQASTAASNNNGGLKMGSRTRAWRKSDHWITKGACG